MRVVHETRNRQYVVSGLVFLHPFPLCDGRFVTGVEVGIHIVYFSMLKALPLATVKVAVLPRPGFEPQTPVLKPERWPGTSNVNLKSQL